MRVVFLGSQEIGARCLRVILEAGHAVVGVGTFEPDAHEQWTDEVARLAADRGLHRIKGRRFRTPDAMDELKALAPDILFAIGWRWILPKAVLEIPPKGCLGIHGSLLPKGRGFAPVNWAILWDQSRTGPSLFYFDEGTDTGDLVGQRPFDITDEDDAGTVRTRLADASVALLRDHLEGLAHGTAPRMKQPAEGATYGERRRPEDGVIDWTWPPRRVFNWIRGLTRPYPGASTHVAGRPALLWKGRVAIGASPGAGVVASEAARLIVGAGDGAVELLDANFAGDEAPGAFARFDAAARAVGRFG